MPPLPFATYRPWKHSVLTLVVLLVLLARVPALWTSGEFTGEDSWVFFAGAWNHSFPGSLFIPYAGYIQFLPRLLAEVWSILPIIVQPYGYAWSGLLLNAVVLAAFYLPVFRSILASDAARLGVVGLLALAPNAENLGVLLGQHWYLAWLFTLLLLIPAPSSRRGHVVYGVCAAVCLWSAPSTYILAPLVAWQAWRAPERRARLHRALLLAQLAVLIALAAWLRASLGERTAEIAPADLFASLPPLLLRGWLGVSVLGPDCAAFLAATAPRVLDAVGLGVALAVLAAAWRARTIPAGRIAAVLVGAGAFMACLSLARTAYVTELATLPLPRHVRYLTAPTLLLHVACAVLLATAVSARGRLFGILLGLSVAVLQFASLGGQRHWSREPVAFRLRDFAPAIARFADRYDRTGEPATLYVPSDVPYWGPVLQRGGGVALEAAAGVQAGIDLLAPDASTGREWLGLVEILADGNTVRHAHWGELRFTGVEAGRIFFRDQAGRLFFTSPLLAPRWWILDGPDWTLANPR